MVGENIRRSFWKLWNLTRVTYFRTWDSPYPYTFIKRFPKTTLMWGAAVLIGEWWIRTIVDIPRGAQLFSGLDIRAKILYNKLTGTPNFPPMLLPDLPKGVPAKKTLVLSTDRAAVFLHNHGGNHTNYYDLRSGLYPFLKKMSKHYEIVLMGNHSSAMSKLLDRIDPEHRYITAIFGSESLALRWCGPVQDLSFLNRPLNRIIVIDSTFSNAFLHQENVIKIKPQKTVSFRDPKFIRTLWDVYGVPEAKPWGMRLRDMGREKEIETWRRHNQFKVSRLHEEDTALTDLVPFLESIASDDIVDVRPSLMNYFDLQNKSRPKGAADIIYPAVPVVSKSKQYVERIRTAVSISCSSMQKRGIVGLLDGYTAVKKGAMHDIDNKDR